MMSFARYQQTLRGLQANARKVYDAIPAGEAWDYSRVHQEMQRLGMNMRKEVVMACIVRLKDADLITMTGSGFQRLPHKQRPDPIQRDTLTLKEDAEVAVNNIAPITTQPAQQPISERLSATAGQLRTLSQNLASVAESLEDIALTIEEDTETNSEAAKRLEAVQAAFKTLFPSGA